MDKWSMLSILLLTASQSNVAASLKNCCKGFPPDIPSFCFDNQPPFDGSFAARCIEDIPFVSFTYYTRDDRTGEQEISRSKIPNNFETTSGITFLVRGWGASPDPQMETLRNNILDVKGGAVIYLKWDGASLNPNYFQSAADTLSLAKEIEIIRTILISKYEMQASMFKCTGHSLGAQICGRSGNMMKFRKITAMDPAGPDFENRTEAGRLTSNSAEFVSVIHTAGAGSAPLKLGMYKPCGHVDFYPNGGGDQPECRLPLQSVLSGSLLDLIGANPNIMDKLSDNLSAKCSHMAAIRLMSESLVNEKCVSRQSCTDHTNLPGSCGPRTTAPLQIIGWAFKYSARGIFYLTTNDKSLYCKG
jgi:hypothetical protein